MILNVVVVVVDGTAVRLYNRRVQETVARFPITKKYSTRDGVINHKTITFTFTRFSGRYPMVNFSLYVDDPEYTFGVNLDDDITYLTYGVPSHSDIDIIEKLKYFILPKNAFEERTIQVGNVLVLNGYGSRMSEYFYQQRWFAMIKLTTLSSDKIEADTITFELDKIV